MTTKCCSRCDQTKPVSAFYKNERYADGYGSYCRQCHKEYRREYRERKRLEDPEWIERVRAKHREYRRRHGYKHEPDPEKVKARTLIGNAVRDGRMTPADECEDCGHDFSEFRREAHHKDYDKPLEVDWLCSLCHGKRHRIDNQEAA